MEAQNPPDEMARLRKRLQDLLALGYMTPESAGTYEQTLLQIHQEAERRKLQLVHQAATLRRQADAAEAQGHAFSAMASLIYSVVNGVCEAGQKRLREDAERQAEQEARDAQDTAEVDAHRRKGRPKKA